MKIRILTSVSVLALLCNLSFAQQKPIWGLSTKTGLSRNYVESPHNFGNSRFNMVSYGIGGFYRIPITKRLSFQPQVWYLNKGHKDSYLGKYVGNNDWVNFQYNYRNHYLSTDATFRYEIGNLEKPHLFIQGGLREDIYLFSNWKSNHPELFDKKTKLERNTYLKPFNTSGIVAIGIAHRRWEIGLEYNQELFSIEKKRALMPSEVQFKNTFRVLSLHLTYKF
jgi:Outer membrane protein beta-barrel domain